ncbi:Glyoxalase-like domain protein [Streptomyces sp. ADI96-02]|uniref:VOC family protein n=1 Tax=Streptomyces sp. ADI96-02 TaxID=1522760 RepID=UPI000F556099|nr:VOC family protein [Streptomyces sp. ADI96-02]RPK55414.1 Glyoxalase-like domain protein [Streptomyces sp. ADI96-02]
MRELNWFDNVEPRVHPWPGLTWMTTGLSCDDVAAAVEFYSSALSFVAIAEVPDDKGKLIFARMRYRGTNFTLNSPEFDPSLKQPKPGDDSNFAFYVYVDDVRAVESRVKLAGGETLVPVAEQFWGDLKVRMRDPFGYVWDFAQPIQAK